MARMMTPAPKYPPWWSMDPGQRADVGPVSPPQRFSQGFVPALQSFTSSATDWADAEYTAPQPGQFDAAISQAAGALNTPAAAAGPEMMALSSHPAVAIGMALTSAAFGVNDIIQGKKQHRKERRRIKAQFAGERRRARLDIVDGGEGVARRMGSDVAAQMSAAGMGGSGAAMGAVMNNRMQVLANIPGQLSSAMTSINASEEQARMNAQAEADAAWNGGMAGIAKAIPILGQIKVRR